MARSRADDRRTRVLIVSAYALPHIGGVEVVVAQQARTLAALGAEVRLITSRCGAGATRHSRVDGYEISRVAAWNALEKRAGIAMPIWSPTAIWRLIRLVARADVVHVHDVYHACCVIAACLAKLFRRPLFVTTHVAIVNHGNPVVESAQRLVYSSAGRLLWRWAATIIAYNPIVAGFIARHGVPVSKIRLSYNGIDTTEFRPGDAAASRATRVKYGLATDIPVILFAGRLVPKKGVDKLIAASGPEYQIVLAGPGRRPDDVPAGVTFLGPVSRAELLSLYQASDIFALPAVGEMLTLAMQEAMSCGLPVVTTADASYDQYELDPAGVALVPARPAELRAAFLAILSDPARSQHMRTYSRQVAEERFDWRKNAVRLASAYDAARSTRQHAHTPG